MLQVVRNRLLHLQIGIGNIPLRNRNHRFPNRLGFQSSIPLYPQSPPFPTLSTSRNASACAGAASAESVFSRKVLYIPPGIEPEDITEEMVLPGSNIVLGPFTGDAKIKEVEFVKSSNKPKDCPRDGRPEFAVLGRSNVGKSSLINSLVRKKEVALTSKKPGKTQLINHFLVNKSWYLVDLPGYGFAKASESAKTDWSSFTKGYFLDRETLVAVLLLVDASVPPQKIDLDCANWLGRNDIPITFVFTKCDKVKGGKGTKPIENVRNFQDLISQSYRQHPPWIMTSSVTGLGRDDLLRHMSQLRNYWED